MHSQLLAALPRMDFGSRVCILPSLTIQITPTRFRVPDIAIFDTLVRNEKPVVTTPPWAVIEILSPEDTLMQLDELVADYRCMGIANIWIVDPRQSSAWNCTPAGWLRTDTITVPGTTVLLNLAELAVAEV